ncbi:bone morphogenetic protein-like protein [Leptotrombidium deliense]|uniref:Bone morphogenetic protein-like protein n=1 Tax=Leptotrombidium deliense TaxID=299467 RepID=A0A443S6V3_9ACAR|nr:bone morphogenetic protein-like protein [Leptotrombidium deliense]
MLLKNSMRVDIRKASQYLFKTLTTYVYEFCNTNNTVQQNQVEILCRLKHNQICSVTLVVQLNDDYGTFRSNNFAPKTTKNAESHKWIITSRKGYTIELNITNLEITEKNSCNRDYIKISEGEFNRKTLVYTFSSDVGRLTVEYRATIAQIGYRGFIATYKINCGGYVTGTDGIISSPNYPNKYEPNMYCVWKIRVPDDHKLKIHAIMTTLILRLAYLMAEMNKEALISFSQLQRLLQKT